MMPYFQRTALKIGDASDFCKFLVKKVVFLIALKHRSKRKLPNGRNIFGKEGFIFRKKVYFWQLNTSQRKNI